MCRNMGICYGFRSVAARVKYLEFMEFLLQTIYKPVLTALQQLKSITVTKLAFAILWYLSGVPDYFDRNKISSGGDLSHYSSASLY